MFPSRTIRKAAYADWNHSHLPKELKLHCDNTVHQQSKKKSRQAVHKILQTKIFNVSFLSRAEIIFNNFPKGKKSFHQMLDKGVGMGGKKCLNKNQI